MKKIISGSFIALLAVVLASCGLHSDSEKSMEKSTQNELKSNREIGFYAEIGKKINPMITEEIDLSKKSVMMLQDGFNYEMTEGDDSLYFCRKTGAGKKNRYTFYRNNGIKICEAEIGKEYEITKFAKYGERFFCDLFSWKNNRYVLTTIDIKTGKLGREIIPEDFRRAMIYNNRFYCLPDGYFADAGDLVIYSIDGSVEKVVLQREEGAEDTYVSVQFLVDDKIYYLEYPRSSAEKTADLPQRTVKIRRCDLDGKGAETLFQYRCPAGTDVIADNRTMQMDKSHIYLLAPYSSDSLTRIPLYGGEIEGVASTFYFDLSEKNIFYSDEGTGYIYKIKKDLDEKPILVTKLHSEEVCTPFLYADGHLMVEVTDKKEWSVIDEILEWGDDKESYQLQCEYAGKYDWISETGEVDDEIEGSGLKKEFYDDADHE